MSPTLSYSEKLAFIKMVDSIIEADDVIHDAEIEIMSQFMQRYEFDSEFVAKAKKENIENCVSYLVSLPSEKKSMIIRMLNVVALSDGFIHKKEMALIMDYCIRIGLCRKIG